MYKRILVPVDGSHTANAGLREAVKLAQEQDAQILVVHVVDDLVAVSPYLYGSLSQNVLNQLRANGQSVLTSAQAYVDKAGVAVDAWLVQTCGSRAGEQIIKTANEWAADLIVCGTHGRRGLQRVVMGSDAEYILRQSPVPVLLVRATESQPAAAERRERAAATGS